MRRPGTRRVVLGIVALAVLVASCGVGPVTAAHPGQRPQTRGPDTGVSPSGAETHLDPGLGLLIGTPVYDGDFADPYVLVDRGVYYAYASNTKGANLPVIRTEGNNSGRYFGDAFPTLPAWTTPGFVWAPAVYATGDHFIVYYTTVVNATGRQCVSRAVGPSPLGPFTDDSTAPMVCQTDLGGTIDPSVVVDTDGRSWLLFKNDGNCCDIPTSLWSQQLAPDGLSVVGSSSKLLTADQPWEGNLIEAPSMVINGGMYFLFYSANAWDTANYAVGYGTCQSITGPCTKPSTEPWMTSTTFAKGPGGQEWYASAGQLWMVYHGWARGEIGYPQGERRLYLDSVRIIDGRPVRVGAEQASMLLGLLITVMILLAMLAVAVAVFVQRHRRRRRSLKTAVSR